jgi:hypothetical protein
VPPRRGSVSNTSPGPVPAPSGAENGSKPPREKTKARSQRGEVGGPRGTRTHNLRIKSPTEAVPDGDD